jgi:predicted ribosome quality control (RQC) complex YloA/Tae2 family protein
MYVDALTMAAVADELRAGSLGGRVQEVLAVDPLSLGLEIYALGQRRYLLISADPQWARVHLVGSRLRRGQDVATPLWLLLRKWVRDARLIAVEQPPFERVLRLRFEHAGHGACSLLFECMGRHSNIVLLDAGDTILECIKRVGADINRYRVVLPQQPYVPPPPQDKWPPDQLTELRLRESIAAGQPDDPAWKLLVRSIQGVSPLLAREACHRAWGDSQIRCGDAPRIHPMLIALQDIFSPRSPGDWAPSVAFSDDDEADDALACFAPYALTHYARWERVDSISEAIERWIGAGSAQVDTYRVARERLQTALDEAIGRVSRRRSQLLAQMKSLDDLETLRLSGEMILAYGWNMEPGQTILAVDLGDGSSPLQIPVDPGLTPAENARRYFDRYGRAKRAGEEIPPLLDKTSQELDRLQQLALDLQLAENRAEIDDIDAELVVAGYKQGKARSRRMAAPAEPLSQRIEGEFTVLVGRNSRQNDRVTFKLANGDDLWFHARGVAGAHVILRAAGRDVPDAALLRAAELAAHYSAAGRDARVEVDYTLRRHVRRQPGGAPGQVFYRHEQTLIVQPRP